jgi:hypothetical protein
MPTLVEYTDSTPALNAYPDRLISPTRPGPCCAGGMAFVSGELCEGLTVFRYKRCVRCGYTVRHIVRKVLSTALVDALRHELAIAFTRVDYDLSGVAAEEMR